MVGIGQTFTLLIHASQELISGANSSMVLERSYQPPLTRTHMSDAPVQVTLMPAPDRPAELESQRVVLMCDPFAAVRSQFRPVWTPLTISDRPAPATGSDLGV